MKAERLNNHLSDGRTCMFGHRGCMCVCPHSSIAFQPQFVCPLCTSGQWVFFACCHICRNPSVGCAEMNHRIWKTAETRLTSTSSARRLLLLLFLNSIQICSAAIPPLFKPAGHFLCWRRITHNGLLFILNHSYAANDFPRRLPPLMVKQKELVWQHLFAGAAKKQR